MQPKLKTRKELTEERELSRLVSILRDRGIEVRREKLSRGYSYRVKSGDCIFSGDNHHYANAALRQTGTFGDDS